MKEKLKLCILLVVIAILCGFIFGIAVHHYNLDKDILDIKEPTETETEKKLNMTFLGDHSVSPLYRISCYHDDDRNMTCYIYNNKGGISCIPDADICG